MNRYLPTDPNIYVLGRTKESVPMPLFWTGSGLEMSTDSGELWIDLETDYEINEEWLRIEVDGFCMQRMMLPKGRSRICAFRNWPRDTVRRVRILKEIQPMRDDEKKMLLIHGLECDGELYKIEKRYKIEIVGDSLSSGEGLGGAPTLQHVGSSIFGLENHYAIRVADHFDADFRILSESGWGVYCSCLNDFICVMPQYYEQICGTVQGERNEKLGAFEKNDFEKWKPDVIIVNLGTNDGFALNQPAWVDPNDGSIHKQQKNSYGGVSEQSARCVENAAKSFLKKLRALNPESYILWVYGMCEHVMAPYLEYAVEEYIKESKDQRASFQILPMTVPFWTGCNNHPGRKDHELAAQVIIHKLETILDL